MQGARCSPGCGRRACFLCLQAFYTPTLSTRMKPVKLTAYSAPGDGDVTAASLMQSLKVSRMPGRVGGPGRGQAGARQGPGRVAPGR